MRFPLRYLACLLFLVALSSDLAGQTPAGRDAAAVKFANQAVAAMGVMSPWSQIKDAVVSGNCTAPQEQGGASSNFRWTNSGKEFRQETDTVNGGPVYLSVHGKPNISDNNGSLVLASTYFGRMKPYHLPGLTLKDSLNDPSVAFLSVTSDTLNGSPATHLRMREEFAHIKLIGSDQDWWFDTVTGLPLRVEYNLPTQTESLYVQLHWDFSNWSLEGTVLVPHLLTQSMSQGDLLLQTCKVGTVSFNTNPAAKLFEAR